MKNGDHTILIIHNLFFFMQYMQICFNNPEVAHLLALLFVCLTLRHLFLRYFNIKPPRETANSRLVLKAWLEIVTSLIIWSVNSYWWIRSSFVQWDGLSQQTALTQAATLCFWKCELLLSEQCDRSQSFLSDVWLLCGPYFLYLYGTSLHYTTVETGASCLMIYPKSLKKKAEPVEVSSKPLEMQLL